MNIKAKASQSHFEVKLIEVGIGQGQKIVSG